MVDLPTNVTVITYDTVQMCYRKLMPVIDQHNYETNQGEMLIFSDLSTSKRRAHFASDVTKVANNVSIIFVDIGVIDLWLNREVAFPMLDEMAIIESLQDMTPKSLGKVSTVVLNFNRMTDDAAKKHLVEIVKGLAEQVPYVVFTCPQLSEEL